MDNICVWGIVYPVSIGHGANAHRTSVVSYFLTLYFYFFLAIGTSFSFRNSALKIIVARGKMNKKIL